MKKFTCVFLSVLILMLSFTSLFSVSVFAEDNVVIHDEDALHADSYKIVNTKGEEVFLRGINLGGWLIMEDWFCPVDNDKTGDVLTYEVLESRFGTEKTYELMNIYQDNWIVESDFLNIAEMGFNCVRIPFWYRNFQSDNNGTWILDENGEIDLSRLEWAVEMCRKYGLYAILDLHAANGVQGLTDHAGHRYNYHFFDQDEKGEWYRAQAVELWRVIAERFAGDPAIAMFDLLNEPMCNVPVANRIHSRIWDFYDDCYEAIRKEDPTRMITMIGTWSVDKLPDPKEYGWENVVYQYHQYDKKESDYTTRIANGWACYYDVPQYAGEFHPVDDKVTLEFAIDAYDSNDVVWSLWTYKGYNSWAAWSDWFCYGSTDDEFIVDIYNDDYDTIAYKWGAVMQTNSNYFYEGQLFKVAKQFLPERKVEAVPFRNQWDIDRYVAGEVIKGNFSGNNECSMCDMFMGMKDVPLLGAIMRFFHSLIHSISTGKNI